ADAGQLEGRLAQDRAIEEGNGRGPQVAGPRGELAFDQEMMEIGTDFFDDELIGRAMVVVGQSGDGIDIALDGAVGELTELHLADHALAKRGHGVAPGATDQTRASSRRACRCSIVAPDTV